MSGRLEKLNDQARAPEAISVVHQVIVEPNADLADNGPAPEAISVVH